MKPIRTTNRTSTARVGTTNKRTTLLKSRLVPITHHLQGIDLRDICTQEILDMTVEEKSGNWNTMRTNEVLQGTVTVLVNITKRKQTMKNLRRNVDDMKLRREMNMNAGNIY